MINVVCAIHVVEGARWHATATSPPPPPPLPSLDLRRETVSEGIVINLSFPSSTSLKVPAGMRLVHTSSQVAIFACHSAFALAIGMRSQWSMCPVRGGNSLFLCAFAVLTRVYK